MKAKQALDIDALVAAAVPPKENPQLVIAAPIRVVSEANEREHWRTKHSRKKKQQETLSLLFRATREMSKFRVAVPCSVRLVRIGPKRLDVDNLAGSMKHVQDEVARQLGIDDGDERIKWEYAQVAVGKRVYSVRVEVY